MIALVSLITHWQTERDGLQHECARLHSLVDAMSVQGAATRSADDAAVGSSVLSGAVTATIERVVAAAIQAAAAARQNDSQGS